MEITRRKIRNKNRGAGHIRDYVVSILSNIEYEIEKHHELRNSTVYVELPKTFDIPYMSKADAQQRIYYRVLRELKKRDFKEIGLRLVQRFCPACEKHVRTRKNKKCSTCNGQTILRSNDKNILIIHLETQEDINEKRKMSEYIRQHLVS